MEEVFIGFINDEKYGKLAHYIDSKNDSVFYRVIETSGKTILEEVEELEKKELLSRIVDDFSCEGLL